MATKLDELRAYVGKKKNQEIISYKLTLVHMSKWTPATDFDLVSWSVPPSSFGIEDDLKSANRFIQNMLTLSPYLSSCLETCLCLLSSSMFIHSHLHRMHLFLFHNSDHSCSG